MPTIDQALGESALVAVSALVFLLAYAGWALTGGKTKTPDPERQRRSKTDTTSNPANPPGGGGGGPGGGGDGAGGGGGGEGGEGDGTVPDTPNTATTQEGSTIGDPDMSSGNDRDEGGGGAGTVGPKEANSQPPPTSQSWRSFQVDPWTSLSYRNDGLPDLDVKAWRSGWPRPPGDGPPSPPDTPPPGPGGGGGLAGQSRQVGSGGQGGQPPGGLDQGNQSAPAPGPDPGPLPLPGGNQTIQSGPGGQSGEVITNYGGFAPDAPSGSVANGRVNFDDKPDIRNPPFMGFPWEKDLPYNPPLADAPPPPSPPPIYAGAALVDQGLSSGLPQQGASFANFLVDLNQTLATETAPAPAPAPIPAPPPVPPAPGASDIIVNLNINGSDVHPTRSTQGITVDVVSASILFSD